VNETPELLSTKLATPRPRPSLVPRQQLLARLDTCLQRKLTLISAPAGFGKTTLVSEWIGSHGPPGEEERFSAAWLSLDAGDNDPVRFWRYVLAACRRFDEYVGHDALAMLHSPQLISFDVQQFTFESMLTTFLNDLNRLSCRCVLVLEDYHLITSAEIHDSMAFLLDHLPEPVHMMILTRSDPPLPMARLRARGETLELRATDLRFSLEDTRSFLQQTVSFPISEEVAARLQERTEGWPAGLNLIALALQGRSDAEDREHFLDTFTGSYRHVLEYLVGDVLNAQPEPVQIFLLQTSGLSRLTAPICDAVTGRHDSETLLQELERANLFLIPLDGSGQWYRYHALFTEAMQHEAHRRLGEDALQECYASASRWYEQHGMMTEAVEAALSAHAYARAAELIEKHAEFQKFREVFEYYTLTRWLGQLPEEVMYNHPRLCFDSAFLFSLERETPEGDALIESRLQVAEQYFRAEGLMADLGGVYALRALRSVWRGDLTGMIAYAKQGLACLPEDEMNWRSSCLSFLGAEEMLDGKLNAARLTLLKARALCEATGNRYAIRPIDNALAQVYFGRGELNETGETYRLVLTGAEEDNDLYDKGLALLGLSRLSYEWNDLDIAEQQAGEALELCKHGTHLADAALDTRARMSLALIFHAKSQGPEGTQHALQMLASIPVRTTPEQFRLLHREMLSLQARMALSAGDISSAQRWAVRFEQSDEPVPRSHQEQESMIVARLRLAEDKPQEALNLLGIWRASALKEGRVRSTIEIELLDAQAYAAMSRMHDATRQLSSALQRAQPDGFRRIFLDEGVPIKTLLLATLPEVREQPIIGYIKTLLQDFDREESGSNGAAPSLSKPLAPTEPLSVQEQRVLRLFAAGLSRQEIAGELTVSVNTVKTHLQRIYRKLAVTNRAEAREAARQLKLL
jgi:LuxR family maltose regulon positive regulatory protein